MTPVLEFVRVAPGLVGRNGAGKTTLIKIAMGLLYLQGGAVRVFGLSPTDQPVEVKKRVGYVAEDQALRGGSTIGSMVRFYRRIFPDWDEALERELLDRFGLSLDAKIVHLSRGQSQQAALLCAVCHRPKLLLLDEPAGGMDPVARREFLETSIRLLNREGTSILFSSHHMPDIERIGGRVIMLDEGRIKLDKNLDTISENICVAIVPRASVPDASVLQHTPGCLRVRLVYENWHVVVEGEPETVHDTLIQTTGHSGVRCSRVPLEELFIELAGGSR
jgi:ABC-2 type transport system ATP-binding protein